WWLATFERKTVTHPLPPTGEARTNPLYGLKAALRASGQRVDARPTLALASHPLGARDTLLLLGNTSTTPARDADAVMEWVQRGGHLLVFLDRNDHQRTMAGRVPVQVKTLDAEDCLSTVPTPAEKTYWFCSVRFAVTGGNFVTASWQGDDGYASAPPSR